jgi:hypothetical protein
MSYASLWLRVTDAKLKGESGVDSPCHQLLLAFGINFGRGGLLRRLLYSYVSVISMAGASIP